MGEVLENGVYLPDEGERNAYNGLKGNWNTVDTVVAQVQALSSTGLIRKPVDELPTEDIETNVIYMLKAVKPNGDVYRIEYMYIDGHWDALGTSETTLEDYYTKTETDDLPAVKSGINATKVSNYDTHLANNDIHVTLANKQSWDGKQNALDTAQTAAVNSGVNAAKVTRYDTHVSDTDIHVTTSDKTAWNGKQDGLSQTQLAAVNSGITEAKITGYDNHVADTDVHVTTTDKAAWNGKQNALTQTQLDNIAAVPDKADSADLATVATTGDYGDLLNAPAIPTVNNASLTIQKNGTDVATFTANASSNVTANLAIPVNTSDLNNDAGFLTQHNPIDNKLSATSENALQNKVVKSELDGKAPFVHTHAASDVTSGIFNIARIPNLDASKITSGTIDIARLPKGALERLVKVANQSARYALTTDDVQLGDTVQQLDTGVMYVVTDETKLDSADGYTEFTAGSASSVPWTGVTGKPSDYPPSSHTHTKSQITDFPALATVATSGSYTDLSNIPASFTPASHTHGNITNDGKVGTTANVPLITGTGGVVQAGSFGNQANTFCEGNDSRLSDARTPVAHTHTKSDVTDLFNSANTWSGEQTFSQTIQGNAATASAFDTAKSITLTGAVTGTVSGTNSWEIATVLKTGSARTGGTVTNPYFKIASWEVAPNKYFGAILQIQNKCYPDNIATLIISVRTRSDATLQRGTCLLTNVRGFTSNDFILLYKEVTGKLLCELYYHTITPFNGIRFSVISEGVGIQEGDSLFNTMIVYRDPTGIAALPSDYTVIQTTIGTYTQDFIPYDSNTYDLGSSSYQWNNLYAKNYYYDGTAWGLDKANVWTKTQNFVGEYQGTELSSNYNTCFGMYGVKDTVGKSGMFFTKYRPNKAQGSLTASDIIQYGVDALENEVRTTNVFDLQVGKYDSNTGKFTKIDVISTLPNANLGTSNNKWTTLNGINPGALSIFNPSATQDPIDVPNTWATDGSAWNTLNVSNMGDGWICLTYRLCGANDYILARFGGASASTCPSMIFPATLLQDSKYYIYTLMPVTKAMGNIYLEINLDSNAVLVKHSFIPAYGTV